MAACVEGCGSCRRQITRTAIGGASLSGRNTTPSRWYWVVVPSADTIVELADGAFRRILPREALARCQTPQGFLLSVIAQAYELAAADPDFAASPPTDDCGVVLRYLPDVPVGAVPGSERNLKITYAADLAIAEALLTLGDPAD